MGVNIKQAKYAGPGVTGDPPVPESGKSQPVLDTANNEGMGPGVRFVQATYCGPPGYEVHGDPGGYMPTGGSIPTGSTDVQNPEAQGHDATPSDIFKGGTGNG